MDAKLLDVRLAAVIEPLNCSAEARAAALVWDLDQCRWRRNKGWPQLLHYPLSYSPLPSSLPILLLTLLTALDTSRRTPSHCLSATEYGVNRSTTALTAEIDGINGIRFFRSEAQLSWYEFRTVLSFGIAAQQQQLTGHPLMGGLTNELFVVEKTANSNDDDNIVYRNVEN